MLTTVIILTMGILLISMVSYWAILRLLNERNEDRERYADAIRNQYKLFTEAKHALQEQCIEEKEQAYGTGRQEGKRAVLSWIKQNVDDGTMTVKVHRDKTTE